ncbi:MAG TPA: XRE family transcriptional regulator [Myxococcales bacterium]|jgi:Zn-dependent peptidase ImmA (M78 family)/DNA-binding XRE family transcriptional regulator
MKQKVPTLQELGSRLAEARKASGLTQADLAREVGLDRTAVTKIESGTRSVDSLELSRIAAALQRPVDWFLVLPPPLVASRRAALDVSSERPADVQLEMLARDVEQMIELGAVQLPDVARPAGTVRTVEDAERAAGIARQFLKQPEGPLKNLLRAAELLGVVGASLDLRDDKLDGSYVALSKGGVALINGGTPSGRRRFTLAHELGHHVLADSYSAEWIVTAEDEDRERLVSAFAIHFLMPRDSVVPRWAQLHGRDDPRRAAIVLGAEFAVSWTAVCAQLRNLELISDGARRALAEQRPSKAEFLELELFIEEDLRPPALAPGFSSAVVKAYRKHKLSRERAIELLRGTAEPQDLPPQDAVPLEAMQAEIMPLDE